MKRRDDRKRTAAEQRIDNARHLNAVEREAMRQPKYHTVFTERPHYGIPESAKGARA